MQTKKRICYTARMCKRVPFLLLLVFFLPCRTLCEQSMQLMHHTTKGMGSHTGYSSADFFLLPHENEGHDFIPFINARGHLFNDGEIASNLGFGGRFPTSFWNFGSNLFYDYRQMAKEHFHQVGVGLEALSEKIDFRLNGYLPIKEIGRDEKQALSHMEAEIGWPLFSFFACDVYTAIGSYYLSSNDIGGKTKMHAQIADYLFLGLEATYDSLYRSAVQGIFSFSMPLGPKPAQDKKVALHKKRIHRNEIIPLAKRKTPAKTLPAAAPLPPPDMDEASFLSPFSPQMQQKERQYKLLTTSLVSKFLSIQEKGIKESLKAIFQRKSKWKMVDFNPEITSQFVPIEIEKKEEIPVE